MFVLHASSTSQLVASPKRISTERLRFPALGSTRPDGAAVVTVDPLG